MRAAVIKQHTSFKDGKISSDAIVFEEKPLPIPKHADCLIRVKACGLNHLDTWVRRGVAGHKFPLPLVPGSDIAGVVEKVGSQVQKLKPGDRVIINPGLHCGVCEACNKGQEFLCVKWGLLGEMANGGCQEYICLDQKYIHPLSSKISFEQAACIPVAYVTAWQMLVGKAKLQTGESILIHAAGSGVSIACIEIAKMLGVKVFVTSTSDEKLNRVKNLAVSGSVNSKKESFVDFIKSQTAKQGVDVVVDHVGTPTMMDSIRCLKRGGRLVSCGATAGSDISIDWKYVFFKNLTLHGSTYGSNQDFLDVLAAVEQGKLSPIIDSTIQIEDLIKAHQALESGKVFGKVIALL